MTTVTVLQPTISISANPGRVQVGTDSTISWDASQVASCAVTRNGVAWGTGLSSSGIFDTVTGQTKYEITCQTNGSPVSESVIVNILTFLQEF